MSGDGWGRGGQLCYPRHGREREDGLVERAQLGVGVAEEIVLGSGPVDDLQMPRVSHVGAKARMTSDGELRLWGVLKYAQFGVAARAEQPSDGG